MVIDFTTMVNLFDKEWDFSYLTKEEINEVLNFPVKMAPNLLEDIEQGRQDEPQGYFIVAVHHTEDYDYSIVQKFQDRCIEEFGPINIQYFWCNYKYAAMLAGLGQYAKNSLLYHKTFKFDTHIAVFQINEEFQNLPVRQPANKQLLSLCNGCYDCAKACPVQAIHNNEGQIWIDMNACDNFCFFGNDDRIPSIKWNNYQLSHLTKEELFKITSYKDYTKIFPNQPFESSFLGEDGQIHWIQYPTCRECTSQKKCSKYNGQYPYDWNRVKIL